MITTGVCVLPVCAYFIMEPQMSIESRQTVGSDVDYLITDSAELTGSYVIDGSLDPYKTSVSCPTER